MQEVILEVTKHGTGIAPVDQKKMIGQGGGTNFLCGDCKTVLLQDMAVGQVSNLTLRCGCGAENKI